ncbi:MAG: hypothetical protein AB7O96_08385 [Pseudobdellovibrionaceae bacterium]
MFGAYRIFWTDSELWPLHISKALFTDSFFVFETKPIFNFILWLVTRVPLPEGFVVADLGRLLFGLNALLISFLVYKVARCNNSSKFWPLFAAFLCISTYIFSLRGIEIRSDFLATTFVLLALYFELKEKHVLFFLFLAMAFFATPKAVYLIFASLVLFLTKSEKSFRTKIKTPIRIVSTSLILLGLAFFTFQIGKVGLADAFRIYLGSFTSAGQGFFYFSVESFKYVFRFLRTDYVFSTLLLVSLIYSLFNLKKDKNIRPFLIFNLLILFFMIVHPEKLPFYIASLIPLFSIFIASNFQAFVERQNKRSLLIAISALILFQTYSAIKNKIVLIKTHNNSEQRETIIYLTDYFAKFKYVRYFDSLGLIQDRLPEAWFLGPGQPEGNKNVVNYFIQWPPDIVLVSAKIDLMFGFFKPLLDQNYIMASPDVYLRAVTISLEPKEVKKGLSFSKVLNEIEQQMSLHWTPKSEFFIRVLNEKGEDLSEFVKTKIGSDSYPLRGKYESTWIFEKKGVFLFPSQAKVFQITPFGFPELPIKRPLFDLFRFDLEY